MHLALLGLLVFSFARAPRFDDASESIPVDTISLTQMNEIMQGEKEAKPALTPTPPPKGETLAPPPPPEPPPDLRKAEDTPEPPAPPVPPERPDLPPPPPPVEPPPRPAPPAPEPPPKPTPPKPEPPKPEPPQPPPKPAQEPAPSPPVKPKTVEKPVEKPPEKVAKPPDKPEKFKPDQLAKLLAKPKTEDTPKPTHEGPKAPVFDKNAIEKLLGTKTADATPTGSASQGLANHHAQRMSVSLENSLNEWFTDAYLRCWTPPPTTPSGENYVFDVRVNFNPDGSLSGKPVMTNPPHDTAWRAHAESAMRAVMKCNPLPIPSQYTPFFDQWKTKTIHFDPTSAQG